MATRSFTVNHVKKGLTDKEFHCFIVDSLKQAPYYLEVSGYSAVVTERRGSLRGGLIPWVRKPGYVQVNYNPAQHCFLIVSTVKGFLGAAYNGRFAADVGYDIAVLLKAQAIKDGII